MTQPQQFYTLKEFLKQVGISYTAYRNLRKKNLMPPEVRVSERTILFRKEAVDEWAKSKESSLPSTQPQSSAMEPAASAST